MRTSTPRAGRGHQRLHEVLVGDEVRVRHPDVAARPVDRLEVHRPDRERPLARQVAVHPDPRLPVGRGLDQEWSRVAAVAPVHVPLGVPEVGERTFQVPDTRAGDPAVGVAPLGGVRGADVVAADERVVVVHDEDLAVVAPVAAEVEEPQPGVVDGVGHHPQRGREHLEPWGHDDVGERVVDRVHLDPAVGRARQRRLEAPPRSRRPSRCTTPAAPGASRRRWRPACRRTGPGRRCTS